MRNTRSSTRRRPAPLLLLPVAVALVFAGCASGRGGSERPIAIVGGQLIDGTGAPPIPDATVVVSDGRIVAAGPSTEIAIERGARRIEVADATIMPGFINAHVHDAYDADRLREWARQGVTTVRDEGIMGYGTAAGALAVRDELAGDARCARLVSAGFMLGPPAGYGQRSVRSVGDARRFVTEEIDAGVDVVKFSLEDGYAQWRGLPIFRPEVVAAIVDTAHDRGIPVSVHICDARFLPVALDAGVDDIAHIQWDHVSDELIARIVDRGVTVVPTLTVLEAFGSLHGAQSNLRRMAAAGVTIALGNDYTAVPQNGFDRFELGMPMHEIRRMHEAGLTRMQIVVAATRNAARVCGLEGEIGTVAPGMAADLLVVRGDPLADLECLTDVRLVLRDGTIIVGP